MKILCFTDGFMHGGAERQLVGLANLLQKKGYNVTLASYHKENFYKPLMEVCNLTYYQIEGGTKQISKLYACYKYFKKEKFDWIISYKGGSNQICCILKAIGLNYNLIVSERCLVYNFNSYQKKKFFLYRFADFIVPNSYAQERFIANNYSSLATKTTTITNFTDTYYFVPSEKLDDRTNGTFRLLVTARISRQKNIERFLEAIKILKDSDVAISVDWFGGENFGEVDYARKCFNLVKIYSIEDVFTFHQATNNIKEEYQKCDAFCLPSLFEGFPNVICEAMSCGKPILCSDVCDNSSIIKDGVNGFLFNPEDINDIVDKIKQLISLPATKLSNMGKLSREMAIDAFSEETFVNKYINIIEK